MESRLGKGRAAARKRHRAGPAVAQSRAAWDRALTALAHQRACYGAHTEDIAHGREWFDD
jgi:hypothetical protein